MNDVSNLRDTIIPKSDQLNADDLVGTTMTIMINGVSRGSIENPLVLHYNNDGGRPFKPCKTMRKLVIAAWGENGNEWIGRSMTLFCDEKVKWAGKEVGGIRISHLSHIKKRLQLNFAATRGKKQMYTVNILQETMYPDGLFNSTFEVMKKMIEDGVMTAGQVIAKCSQTGTLTDYQLEQINGVGLSKPRDFNTGQDEQQPEPEPEQQADLPSDQDVQNNF